MSRVIDRGLFRVGVRALLRPLVRFTIRHAHTYLDVSDELKRVFLEEAVSELKRTGKKVNASRVSVLTGIYRQEASQMLREGFSAPERLSITARVLGQWQSTEQFTTKSGKPRILSFKGTDSEFHELVSTVSTTVNPGTVLFELLRSNTVEKTSRGLKLVEIESQLAHNPESAFNSLSENMSLVLQSGEENAFDRRDPPNLHMRTEYDNVKVDALPRIREWFMSEGRKFHRKAREFLSQYDADITEIEGNEAGGARVSIGSFSLTVGPMDGEERAGEKQEDRGSEGTSLPS